MEDGHQNESFNTVFNCVIPYIHNGADRNSVSLVCRGWYELDCMTRKHVTVHVTYCPEPCRLVQRFPFLESLTVKGFTKVPIGPWIQELAVSFKHLKALHIRHFLIHNSDLDFLARTRGKDLRVLMINKCDGFSPQGLIPIGKYCNHLKTLMLERNCMWDVTNKDGSWLHELALSNTAIESFSYDSTLFSPADVKSLILLAKNCSQTLVSLKIPRTWNLSDLRDVFSHAVRLEKFDGSYINDDANREYSGFRFPPNIRYFGIYGLSVTLLPFVLPLANQLRELNLEYPDLDQDDHCFLIQRCLNLEVLNVGQCFFSQDWGLQVIGQFCKKLRKLTYGSQFVTRMGLIALAQGCPDMEYLHIKVSNIPNEAVECIGTHLKNLCDFGITCTNSYSGVPLDNGIREMLIGCTKLERLGIDLESRDLTDVGLGYIGKYGHNLRYLCLSLAFTQAPAYEGLVELSKGCPKLRKLELKGGGFDNQALITNVNNLHFLRYARLLSKYHQHFVIQAMARLNSNL